jgi:protein phosphatase methylesterase 1
MAVNPGWTRAPWAGVPQPPAHAQHVVQADDDDTAASFHTTRDVRVGSDTFRVHCAGDWAARPHLPLVVLLHGAGYNGLTWCFVARHLLRLPVPANRVAAVDLRGHGASVTADETDLSLQVRRRSFFTFTVKS